MLRPFGDPSTTRANTCCLCGRRVKLPVRYLAEVTGGGAEFVRLGDDLEAIRADQSSYMGWFAVGPDCAKKLREEHVLIHEEHTR